MCNLFATSGLVITLAVSAAGVAQEFDGNVADPVVNHRVVTDADNSIAFGLAVLWGMEIVGDGLDDHGNNPSPYTQLLGAASPLSAAEWAWIDAVDPGLASALAQVLTPLTECGEQAVLICGEGEVCWVCVTGNHIQSCGYACRASDGSCQPTPPCGITNTAY